MSPSSATAFVEVPCDPGTAFAIFTGDIDSVRVYGHALQPAEVASLLSAPDP